MAQHLTVRPPVTRTTAATFNTNDFNNRDAIGAVVVIDITAGSSVSLTVTIEGKDPTSGKYYTILASSALTGTGTTVLRVHPDLTAAANTVAKDMLPAVWRVKEVTGNTNSITYSIGASMV